MISAMLNSLRAARLQGLMAAGLKNWRDVYRAYADGAPSPPLALRRGPVLHSEPGDSPAFLFLEIFSNGCYRRQLRAPTGGVVVDVGANIGMFSIDCALRYPAVRVHAYEPNPATFRTLTRNIADNGFGDRIEAFNEAVGGSCGHVRFWLTGSMIASAYPFAGDRSAAAIDVPQIDLSEVLARAGTPVPILKIDAEGAEADILEAAPHTLLAQIEQVIGEYHEDRVPGVLDRARTALLAAGFDVDVRQNPRCGPMFYARNRRAAIATPPQVVERVETRQG